LRISGAVTHGSRAMARSASATAARASMPRAWAPQRERGRGAGCPARSADVTEPRRCHLRLREAEAEGDSAGKGVEHGEQAHCEEGEEELEYGLRPGARGAQRPGEHDSVSDSRWRPAVET
jgi:hypothetical protein